MIFTQEASVVWVVSLLHTMEDFCRFSSIVRAGDLSKWLYLCGDGLTQVRLKSFMDVIHNDSVSFKDWYQDSLVISAALERVIIGNGDLHAGCFSCLGCIFTVYYGRFLQVFQYAFGWKRINGLDIAKSFQYGGHVIDIVHNEVSRNLHLLHVHVIMEDQGARDVLMTLADSPVHLSEYLVKSYIKFLKNTMASTSDEVIKLCIGFNAMSTKYITLKKAVRKGDSITVEAMYSYFTPIWLALGKTTYFNIALDQIDELYVKIPYYILQYVRENRFLPLYAGKNAKGVQMARWELDKIMELCNCKFKELDFGNDISGWLHHAQNMPLCCKSRAFVENEYSKHDDVDVYTKKYVDGVDISDISQKVNKTRSSVESKRTNEKIMCAEILNLGKVSVVTPNRKMSTNYFWDLLPLVKTSLVTSKDGEEEAVPDTPLKSYARKVCPILHLVLMIQLFHPK